MDEFWVKIGGIVSRMRAPGPMLDEFAQRCTSYRVPAGGADLELEFDACDGYSNPDAGFSQVDRARCSFRGGQYCFDQRSLSLKVTPGTPTSAKCRCAVLQPRVPLALRLCLSTMIPLRGALMLHAAAVLREGAAYLFAGVSGAGKSTTVSMLADDPHVQSLGDETCIVHVAGEEVTVESTPFGKSRPTAPARSAPLRRLFFLGRSPGGLDDPSSRAARLISNTMSFAPTPQLANALLGNAYSIVTRVRCDETWRPTREDLGSLLAF